MKEQTYNTKSNHQPKETLMRNAIQIKTVRSIKAQNHRSPWRRSLLLIPLALTAACFALAPQARAVCQQGCDLSRANTFLGDDVLTFNTTGQLNTATGARALYSNTTGMFNTASGYNALYSNTTRQHQYGQRWCRAL
jgi:hypothetical protein